ncbi:TPA: hypothetical protein TUT13_001863 [Streptococcus equi subsp. zooepidemicus]|nr:hypothetical protein [Streptococcus equi subsp. zooepidemicus]
MSFDVFDELVGRLQFSIRIGIAQRVNREFLIKQIEDGKDFILVSNPYKAKAIANSTGKGVSYADEIDTLSNNGYKTEKYEDFWRAYK